jgi:CSLREA domain-containing protein
MTWHVAVGGVLLALFAASPARAATFVVNSKTDATDGSCAPAPGGCTLREAIEAAVATAGRDTIRFDASVFPHGAVPVLIPLGSALPVIADPAGTVIDGSGASVRIFGGDAIEDGLVFASAPGVPLTKPTVANVSVDSFTGDGVAICGGLPPTCDADVTNAVVRNVFVNGTGRSGITIVGRVVKKAQVIDSVTFQTTSNGIALVAGTLIDARVEGSTASRSGLDGILVAAGDQTGSVVVDSSAARIEEGAGIRVFALGDVAKLKIADAVTFRTGDSGISVQGEKLLAPSVSDVLTSGAQLSGVEFDSIETTTAPAIERVVADANGFSGIRTTGPVSGGAISDAHIYRHDGPGIGVASADGIALSRVLSAENSTGIALFGARSVIDRVHVSTNGLGIFVADGDGNMITRSASTANDESEAGIEIRDDSHGNVITQNFALGNGVDLFDSNLNCDANVWSDNAFGTRSDPCIH